MAQAILGITREEHERFFRELLADVQEPTLPYGLRDVLQEGAGVEETRHKLSSTLSDRLRRHARRLGVSLASLCHLAWARVSGALSGQDRVVFGTVLLGRMQAGEGATRGVGLFINTLPLRVDVAEDSVETAVRNVHRRLAQLLEHEHASLTLAQRCSGVGSDEPLFSGVLNYRHHTILEELAGSAVRSLQGIEFIRAEERTNYPLLMSVEDDETSLGLTVQVVSEVSGERVCGYMERALESLAVALESAPKTVVRDLQVLPQSELGLLLERWNATAASYPREKLIHELFEEQVRRTPDAVAVISGDSPHRKQLTYTQLNERANRLAHRLLELGIGAEERIGICVERSVEMVIGLLGSLKAGGAYVPLDPQYPSARLAEIVADASPRVLLLDEEGREALAEALRGREVVMLEGLGDEGSAGAEWMAYPGGNPNPQALGMSSQQLAYVIYTSGSTGVPKGVQNEHRAVVNRLSWLPELYKLDESDAVLQKTPFTFDVSVWEFFWTLLKGAKLVLVTPGGHKDAPYLIELIRREQVTTVHFVPSMLTEFLRTQGVEGCSSLRQVICSGEALSAHAARQCQHRLPGAQLYNLYGPTEAAIEVTAWRCPENFSGEVVPIGQPISNTKIYLLDRHRRLVPLGVIGELYIGGVAVARGYLNQPQLTAERFLVDPFSDEPEARMYRTGDLGRYQPDGNIEFLGRNDEQVKIRGFRIEPGEIEARLREHPLVKEAVVLAREDAQQNGPGSKQLVAYILPCPTKQTSAAEDVAGAPPEPEHLAAQLRAHLENCLPRHMVPAAFVRLLELPLTPSGKLDRKKLPAPLDDAFAREAYESPKGELELRLAAIWKDLLRVERVGRHDNFFDLGGHSLLAIQLIRRIQAAFARDIGLRAVMTQQTVHRLATFMTSQAGRSDRQESTSNLIPIRPGTATPLFLIHEGVGGVEYARDLAPFIDPTIPIYGVRATGLYPGETPLVTVEEMVARYAPQIIAVQPRGPYRLGGWSAGGVIAHKIARHLTDTGERVEFLGLLDTTHPSEFSLDPDRLNHFDEKQALLDTLALYLDIGTERNLREYAMDRSFEELLERLHAQALLPPELGWARTVDAPIVRCILATQHAILKAINSCLLPDLSIPIQLFAAADNSKSVETAWRQSIGGPVCTTPVPGTHLTMMSDKDNLKRLGQALNEALFRSADGV